MIGVPPSSDIKHIKKKYYKLAQMYHPDVQGTGDKDEEKLKRINAAYDVLKNEEKREDYDKKRDFALGAGS